MKKREFLKILGVTSVAAVAATQLKASDEKVAEEPKKEEAKGEEWKNEPDNKHSPVVKVTREGDVSTITVDVTKHPQTAEHYIDGIEIRDANKAKIFSATISAVGGVSTAVCQLKLPVGTKLTALSHCNKHGYYQAPVVL